MQKLSTYIPILYYTSYRVSSVPATTPLYINKRKSQINYYTQNESDAELEYSVSNVPLAILEHATIVSQKIRNNLNYRPIPKLSLK